jgi:hypothetical protein
VLEEAQLAAELQHAPQLRERPRLIRHGAQDEARDGAASAASSAFERRYASGSSATTSSTVAG